jgi:malate dehydrogenase (oxaloacetate-decarboxylating)(NADP+)
MPSTEDKRAELRRAALEYHEFPTPGKVAIAATKQMVNQRDLALAYSPGVAAACEEIVADPANAFRYTAAATWWRWSPTAPPCWAWATSARWPPSR